MKAYHLTESEQDQAAIIFGRFNPPHFGHKAAWDIAASFPIWYVGTNQSTQGPKDPLPFDIKMEAMKTFMPELEDHLVAEQSWFTLASMVYKQHGAVTLHIVTDATDAKIFVPALQKQNGLEGPHGFYKFNDIVWSEAERKSEASKVRQAIKDNNPQDFEKYSGVSANTEVAGHPYFNLVRHYMMPYMQAEIDKEKQKVEREKLKAEKEQQKAEKAAMKQTKTKGPAQELAESNLKELSTELLGKYKKAAGADAKKADAEGDYARGDKRFKGINRATNKQFDNDLKKHGQQSVAESVNDYLWHGSKSKHDILYPQQADDTGGKEESNKNAVYATPIAQVAIAMGLTTPGSDTGMFPNDPQMVLFKGGIRKGEMIYLHKVPKDLFIKHNDREWYSKPGVKEVKPLEVVTVPVDKWLHLIRQATPQDLELQKKNLKKQGVAEVKQRLDPKCWKGKHKEGTKIKGGIRVNNCVPNEGRIRIGQALEQIYEAKARGTIPTVDKDAIPNLTRYDQLDNSDSYASYRFGVALAPSPDSTDMDRKSAIANSFAMVDYTDADAKIRRGAEKTMGVRPTTSTGKGSNETNDVNKISPIAKLKRNKYGI